MYSTFNEGKSVVVERFIRTVKNKLYKHMTATDKNVYYDVLDNIVNEYNNTKHSTIKMKPKDVKNDNDRVYIDEHDKKSARYNIGNGVRISKFKNIFAKGYTPNWSREILIINKINDTVPYTYNLKDLNDEEIIGSFYDRELQKSSQYFPPYGSTNNIKVELDLANYATKDDVKNVTHVDVSSYATKTNLAALKSEVDKIDVDKLKTTPTDLAKLSNLVKNDVVKKTDYNTKVTSIENQIVGVTKLKAVDTSNFVLKTKLASDVNTLENKIDTVNKKIPDISGLATKTSLTSYLQTATFNSKVTEVENKIKSTDIIVKSANTKTNTIRSDLAGYAKKLDVATDITSIKNDYVTNASLTSQLNDLKSQHIAAEVTTIDKKLKKMLVIF